MSPLSIEFVEARKPRKAAWSVCAALAVLCAGVTGVAAWERAQIDMLRRELFARQVLATVAQPSVKAVPTQRLVPYDASARALVAEARFDSEAALTALERVAIIGVTPTTVDIDANPPMVRLQVEFTEPTALFDYLQQLNVGDAGRWSIAQVHNGNLSAKGSATLLSHW